MGSITWGPDLAAVYDTTYAAGFAPSVLDPVVGLLAALAGGGPALEFAVGTGRVALALSARGIPVHGLELSRPMAEQLLAKPGASAVPLTLGDMTAARVPGSPPASSPSSLTTSASKRSTTRPPRSRGPITGSRPEAAWSATLPPTATYGLPSLTSWPRSPDSGSPTAGPDGTRPPSPPTAPPRWPYSRNSPEHSAIALAGAGASAARSGG